MDSSDQHDQPGVDSARERLRTAATHALPRSPWQHPAEAPEASTLLRFALQRANADIGHASREELIAALSLIDTARSDLDALETALLLTARAEGLTWAQIAPALGLRSPQAAQQRYQRVSQRPTPEAVSDLNSDLNPDLDGGSA